MRRRCRGPARRAAAGRRRAGGGSGPQRQGEVVGDGHVRPQRVGLEDQAQVPALGWHGGARQPVEEDLVADADGAGVGVFQARHARQGRGLAAAGGPEQGGELPVRDGEVDALQDGGAVEGLREGRVLADYLGPDEQERGEHRGHQEPDQDPRHRAPPVGARDPGGLVQFGAQRHRRRGDRPVRRRQGPYAEGDDQGQNRPRAGRRCSPGGRPGRCCRRPRCSSARRPRSRRGWWRGCRRARGSAGRTPRRSAASWSARCSSR